MIDQRISSAGDPFHAAGSRNPEPEEDRPHGCYEGWVYLGFETEEDGEIVEITERIPCRRCRGREADAQTFAGGRGTR
jgi:hypothetical protein